MLSRGLILCWSSLLFATSATSPDSKAVELQRAVNSAIATGAPVVAIQGGAYHFHDNNFDIFGASKLTILAVDPVTLWFGGSNGVNITNSEDLSLGNWTIDNEAQGVSTTSAGKVETIVTLNLLNCTRVSVTDVSIKRGYNMILTAFNGGGDHKFTRIKFQSTLGRLNRDAIHFSDQRVGPTIVDSVIGYTGDDLFNIHTTLMVVVNCDRDECIMVNPHMHGPEMMNTVYHTNCVMENVLPGKDTMSFFKWPTATFDTMRYPGAPLTVSHTERVTDTALLKEAASLVPELTGPKLNPVSMTNVTVGWQAWDVWRVKFEGQVPTGVGRTAMVQIDTISNSGTTIRNSLLTDTNCNLGRFKSSHSVIEGNTFRNADIKSLELSWLPQFFEGPVVLTNVTVANNIIEGEGEVPVHCGPFCGSEKCLYGPNDRPAGTWTEEGCPQCPNCYESGDTPWTNNIRLNNNTIRPSVDTAIAI